jgi:DNA-binding MarR family transcriptional regulator
VSHGKLFVPTPAELARILAAHAERVRYGAIGARFGVGATVIGRIVREHGTPRDRVAEPDLTQPQRQHLARLARGPAPIVSDPTRQCVLMPAEMLNRQTVARLQARGYVEVDDGRPRMVTITPAGREALAVARAQIVRAS